MTTDELLNTMNLDANDYIVYTGEFTDSLNNTSWSLDSDTNH